MKYYIRLNKYGYINNTYPFKLRAVKLWKDVEQYFTDYDLLTFYSGEAKKNGFKISIDASNIINYYKIFIKETGYDEYGYYYGDPNYFLIVNILGNNDSEVYHINQGFGLINRFLQDLFFAMNIITPGSFEVYGGEFYDKNYESLGYPTVSLSSYFLLKSYQRGRIWKYPKYYNLKINNVWEWLNNIKIPGVSLAENDAQKAVFTILNLSRDRKFTPEHLLILSRGFEALLGDSSNTITKSLKERISLLLKHPTEHKKWLSDFYNYRSRIIHGDLPIFRKFDEYRYENEDFLVKYFENFTLANSVFIAIVHDLIKNKCSGYSFKLLRKRNYV